MAASSEAAPRLTPLDRLFLLFTEVRAGESAGALLLGVNVFLLLGSYYPLKTIREGLILGQFGAEIESYSAAVQAVTLLLLLPVYGWLGSNVNRIKLITWGNLFFVICLVVFSGLYGAGVRIGVAYFIWIGIYNNFVVAQFWAFANDIYSEEQGKRLFPAIWIGGTLGGAVGAMAVAQLIKPLGTANIMLVMAFVLCVCTLLTHLSNRNAARGSEAQRKIAGQTLSKVGGFQLIRHDRYLLLIAAMILMLNTVNTFGQYMMNKFKVEETTRQAVAATVPDEKLAGLADYFRAEPEFAVTYWRMAKKKEELINFFYSGFFAAQNLLCFLMQTFLASRLIKYVGVRGTMFVLPVIAFGGYGLFAIAPALAAVKYTKILENATDYSIMNTVKQTLWLPTSRVAKYKAKAAVDTFVVRCGDMLQAVIVGAGSMLGFTLAAFAFLQVGFVIVWLGMSVLLARQHKQVSTIAGDVG